MKLLPTCLAVSLLLLSLIGFAHAQLLPIPQGEISLASPQGQQLFQQSQDKTMLWPLISNLTTQQRLSFCAIATAVTVLNALDVPAPLDPDLAPHRIFTQSDIFSQDMLSLVTKSQIGFHGTTLAQLAQVLSLYDVYAKPYYANEISLAQFRKLAQESLHNTNEAVIINYDRKLIGQQGRGHISPLAAYNAKHDMFLMLDVARYKYPPLWISTKDLYKGMHSKDSVSHKYRGMIIVKK